MSFHRKTQKEDERLRRGIKPGFPPPTPTAFIAVYGSTDALVRHDVLTTAIDDQTSVTFSNFIQIFTLSS